MFKVNAVPEKRICRQTARVLLAVVLITALSAGACAFAASKSTLTAKIRKRAGEPILKTWYADFDGNGKKEMFAVTGSEWSNRLWFAGDQEVKSFTLDGSAFYYEGAEGICTVGSRQKLFVIESGAGGSGSTSHCYYVKSGRVKAVAKAGEGLRHIRGRQFAIHPGAFDWTRDGTGHTYKRYYLRWDGTGFTEYKGTRISLNALKKYSGAAAILKRAKKEGYAIGNIFRRGNGIINVNLRGSETNENLTLKVSGNKVKLVTLRKSASTWIGKYSYGGKYKARGY